MRDIKIILIIYLFFKEETSVPSHFYNGNHLLTPDEQKRKQVKKTKHDTWHEI